jgi:ankyrin repeat protein
VTSDIRRIYRPFGPQWRKLSRSTPATKGPGGGGLAAHLPQCPSGLWSKTCDPIETKTIHSGHWYKRLSLLMSTRQSKCLRLHQVWRSNAPRTVQLVTAAADFFDEIKHYMYKGDTALHMAAAAYQERIAVELIARGADVRAQNRRGAEPLHYAADGAPSFHHWNPTAQAAVVAYLIQAGADPNAVDKEGVTPLHRAVRTRCAGAVKALLEGGADVGARNKNGSTPMFLANRNTGRGGTGTPEAKAQQVEIVRLLTEFGAT